LGSTVYGGSFHGSIENQFGTAATLGGVAIQNMLLQRTKAVHRIQLPAVWKTILWAMLTAVCMLANHPEPRTCERQYQHLARCNLQGINRSGLFRKEHQFLLGNLALFI
jgi:hypothetical protein